MHLKSLRMSGFKSFVEPTVLRFPDALCAVVGPNGCGKSNIVDALRWVMGTLSSQSLRGGVMTDVIFNGSANRKPLGQASVEMVLDNEDGSFGGAYANQREIVVRREITRAGEGDYFLNGVRVRRRDVLELFMDSGLGPGSYGIIEQGSVTRLAEARPEELRMFLEEAAGIARYREKRRETLQRLQRTRDNMARVADLRRELRERLERLAVQAQAAKEARDLDEAALLAELRLSALQYRVLEEERRQVQERCSSLEADLSRCRARQKEEEQLLRRMREETNQERDRLRNLQAEEYSATAAVTRLEQSLQRCRELAQRYRQEEGAEQGRLGELHTQGGERRERLAQLQEEEAQLAPQQAQLEAQEVEQGKQLEEARAAQEAALGAWEEQGGALEQARSKQERARFAQESREGECQQLEARRAALRQELQSILGQLRDLRREQEERRQRHDSLEKKLGALGREQERLETLREEYQRQLEALLRGRGTLERRLARCRAALETAEQAAGPPPPEGLREEARRIVEQVEVTPGWEQALELVLEHWLEGWSVEDFAALRQEIAQQQGMCILDGSVGSDGAPAPSSTSPELWLGSHVRAPVALLLLLEGVHGVAHLEQAWELLPSLGAGESVVTRTGVWLGKHWLRSARSQSRQGLLERRRLQRRLQLQLQAASTALGSLDTSRQRLESLQQDNSDALRQLFLEKAACLEERTVLAADSKAAAAEDERTVQRWGRLHKEWREVRRSLGELREGLEAGRRLLEELRRACSEQERRLGELRQQREESSARLSRCQGDSAAVREQLGALHTRQAGLRERLGALREALQQADSDSSSLAERVRERGTLAQQEESRAQGEEQELQGAQALRVRCQEQLGEAQRVLKEREEGLSQKDHAADKIRDEAQQLAESLEQARVAGSALGVRYETVQEQLAAHEADAAQLLEEMPADCSRESLQRELDRLRRRRKNLGDVNTGALEEHGQEEQRSEFLDRQFTQLEETLENLARAMAHIDREIRTRFQDAYKAVNENLQQLFPRLFGGGRAHLELESAAGKDGEKEGAASSERPEQEERSEREDDPLQGRLQLLAQPPGKRITRVQLLSGGEKVLTAITLMFALFRYRPAPFCVLDEVDAPLDDHNVRRYTALLEELSAQHQFLFITHNKVSMEAAQRLVGVTMSEPGVSRLVEVSLEELAEELADSEA